MKEEVGMKRWRPSGVLVAFAAAGMVASTGAVALADTEFNVYTNESGVIGAAGAGAIGDRLGGMDLNPGKTGQFLWGTYYDVRPILNGNTGQSDAQDTNIQILNTNSNNPGDPNYDPSGGIIARLRFRESKTSREVLDFDIILSCAEVWTAKVELSGNLPRIVSADPIRTGFTAATFTTSQALLGGRSFVRPAGLTDADIQRGYFEVIAEEGLPCEPIDGQVDRTGDVWQRIGYAPTNALAAEVVLIRVAAGVSYIYNAEAVTRYNMPAGAGGSSGWFPPGSGLPTLDNCVSADNGIPAFLALGPDCTNQMNFILSKSRVMAQYDINPGIGGSTRVVFTLPTKHLKCALNGGQTDFNGVSKPPFSCQGANSGGAIGGEQIGCVPYNRIEDFVEGDDIFSPGETSVCRLPRELSIVGIVADDSPSSQSVSSTVDEFINVTGIPREHFAGWVDFNLFTDPAVASQIHEQTLLNPDVTNLLGLGFTGYRGLPALTLILQEYFNGNVGGVYGGAVPAPYEVQLIKPGQS